MEIIAKWLIISGYGFFSGTITQDMLKNFKVDGISVRKLITYLRFKVKVCSIAKGRKDKGF